jgi:hypothetical protein
MRDFVAAGRAMAMLRDAATSHREPFWITLAHCMEGKLLIRRGEFGSGSALVRTASDTCERTGWTICYPELLRAKAEVLLRGADNQSISGAECCFCEAIDVAWEQDALSWELRSAFSFA